MKYFYKFLIVLLIFSHLPFREVSAGKIFPDVPVDYLYSDHINYIVTRGFASGYPDGTFRPEKLISRAELLKILISAKFNFSEIDSCLYDNEYVDDENTEIKMLFSDISASNQFAKYLCIGKNHEIIRGYKDGSFKSDNEITFGEASKIIIRTLDLSQNISPDSELSKYINRLEVRTSIPPTLQENSTEKSIDKPISRAEASFLIQIVDDNYVKLDSDKNNNLELNRLPTQEYVFFVPSSYTLLSFSASGALYNSSQDSTFINTIGVWVKDSEKKYNSSQIECNSIGDSLSKPISGSTNFSKVISDGNIQGCRIQVIGRINNTIITNESNIQWKYGDEKVFSNISIYSKTTPIEEKNILIEAINSFQVL